MRASRPALLVLSPSVDMFGAGRSLVPVLTELENRYDITLVAPREGPLLDLASAMGCDGKVLADWSLHRNMLRARAVPGTVGRSGPRCES